MDERFDTVGEFVKFCFELFNISIHHAIYYYEALNDLPHIMAEVIFINENDEKEEVDFWDLDENFLTSEYPDIAKVAAFFFGVSEETILEQDGTITDRFLDRSKGSAFFSTAWDVRARIRGGYFKGKIGRNLGGYLTENWSLNEAMQSEFPVRYDYGTIRERLVAQLKQEDKVVPGLYHKNGTITKLSVHTEHFVSCDNKDFLEAFLYIVKRLDILFHKAIKDGLSEEERQEYDFYVLTLNVRMSVLRTKHAFYRNIILFRDFYKDHHYSDLASYLRFYFWHDDYYQPWRCIEFTKYKDLAQSFFNYVPEAKTEMRKFAMEVRNFKCTYTWSDSPHLTFSEEEEEEDKIDAKYYGYEYIPPENRPLVKDTYYLEKDPDELEDDLVHAKELSKFASPPRQGGIRISNPQGRVYGDNNYTKVLLKYDVVGRLV